VVGLEWYPCCRLKMCFSLQHGENKHFKKALNLIARSPWFPEFMNLCFVVWLFLKTRCCLQCIYYSWDYYLRHGDRLQFPCSSLRRHACLHTVRDHDGAQGDVGTVDKIYVKTRLLYVNGALFTVCLLLAVFLNWFCWVAYTHRIKPRYE